MNRVSASRITTLIILVMFFPLVVAAKGYTVTWSPDPDCSGGVCDFQSALTEASSNGEDDTIFLLSTRTLPGGRFNVTSTFSYDSAEEFDLTIEGVGANETVLSGGDSLQLLSVRSTADGASPIEINFSGVAIHHGFLASDSGSGLAIHFAHANVTIENSSFAGNVNKLGVGGGLYLARVGSGIGTAIVRKNNFSHNSAVRGAGLYVGASTVLVEDNEFEQNTLNGNGGGGGGAYVSNGSGDVTVRNNTFSYNSEGNGIEGGRGAGLFVTASGLETTRVKGNRFIRNSLGEGGRGAGAWVFRIDGPVVIESNVFEENVIGGSDKEVGGGGLDVNLFGSGAQGTIVNNLFRGNRSYQAATAASIASLDTTVVFGNNTVVSNHPLRVHSAESTAVSIDAQSVDIYNNIFSNTSCTFDLEVIDDAFTPQTVNFFTNLVRAHSLPASPPPAADQVNQAGNFNASPGLLPYPDFHLDPAVSPAVDAGTPYPSMPAADIDGEARVFDYDARFDGVDDVDIGVDEVGGVLSLRPYTVESSTRFKVGEPVFSLIGDSNDYAVSYPRGLEFEIISVTLPGASTDWKIINDPSGQTVEAGRVKTFRITFTGYSLEPFSIARLVVETSVGTRELVLEGVVQRDIFGDYDGIADWEEGSQQEADGNCDGTPDYKQENVATFYYDEPRFVVVAPKHPIGSRGLAYPDWLSPRLRDVTRGPALDEGSGPVAGREYPLGFLSFGVTATTTGDSAVGGSFPVSIILPEDAPAIDGYVKRGPVPDWFPGTALLGDSYNFVWGTSDHPALDQTFDVVGADIEHGVVLQHFGNPEEPDVPTCERGPLTVIHLRLKDGWVGDHDMLSDGRVFDPGGPAIMPVIENGEIFKDGFE